MFQVNEPPKDKFGDVSTNAAFSLSKFLKTDPKNFADILIKELKNNVNGSNSQDKRKQFIVKTYGEKNSDLPVKFNEFMWPTVYQGTDDKGSEEIYLGTAENIDIELFPEVKFVEDVFTNLAAKRKNLNQITNATAAIGGNDTDNWFPINPIDYEVNPFLKLNVLNNNKEINSEITKQIVERICIIKNYSNLI